MSIIASLSNRFARRAFDRVTSELASVPYMREPKARVMRDIIVAHDAAEILELGFYHGKSSAYIAAILEDRGKGHLTTLDKMNARDRNPCITDVLERLSLSHRVTPIFAERSFTWEIGRLLKADRQFDLAYIDGGHTWDVTGFSFLLVDMLLKSGGVVIFDDLDWTLGQSSSLKNKDSVPQEQRDARQVRMVFDLLVQRRGYRDIREVEACNWGIAVKP